MHIYVCFVGTDEYGEQCHPSMYYDLWINDPKEVFEYPDYTYETHFGKLLPSYLPRSVARDYFPGLCAESWEMRLRGICGLGRPRSDSAFAPSDQGLRCPFTE